MCYPHHDCRLYPRHRIWCLCSLLPVGLKPKSLSSVAEEGPGPVPRHRAVMESSMISSEFDFESRTWTIWTYLDHHVGRSLAPLQRRKALVLSANQRYWRLWKLLPERDGNQQNFLGSSKIGLKKEAFCLRWASDPLVVHSILESKCEDLTVPCPASIGNYPIKHSYEKSHIASHCYVFTILFEKKRFSDPWAANIFASGRVSGAFAGMPGRHWSGSGAETSSVDERHSRHA